MLERWQRLLPHARVERIDGAGHWPHEEEPARVVAALEAFLQ
jgi:pimeloyl-ACP methyl ester carboxylesterase